MKHPIEADPIPKKEARASVTIAWPVSYSISCPAVVAPGRCDFVGILEERRSVRRMTHSDLRSIVNAIAYVMAPRQIRTNNDSDVSRRVYPSAGALHPIETLIVEFRNRPRIFRYDAWGHRLEGLLFEASKLALFRRLINEMLSSAQGTAIVLVGDESRVASRYENPASLLWRDAGALLQTFNLVGTAFGLAVCPLGILGGEVIQAIGMETKIVGCGGLMIGRPTA